ncbi:MAG: hypothetical protein A3D92_03960 [Bacteroidetes bacterium RIFCSPHIGHO2_02_FULL_44_7]|nr:MAG: hypothetical protein A3D92_03960 [Bacteroidetes bacterium RIFCSPHIGHO2_02_FULL_44_7]
MGFWSFLFGAKQKYQVPEFPEAWRSLLRGKISFYSSLNSEEARRFEQAMLLFLNTTRITGIKTKVEDEDRVAIAASAVIPIFGFPNWSYQNLDEVLLYPMHFDADHQIGSKEMAILGMVGYGYMDGKMVLSKKALHHGYANSSDKQNTAIHEFVHLLDKQDGAVDGLPIHLIEEEAVLPWLNLIDAKIHEIKEDESDIRAYGATNRAEFLAVASEYFFERPALLAEKHPHLYAMLEKLFSQRLKDRKGSKKVRVTRHFEPCPCGSGKKFRDCCERA